MNSEEFTLVIDVFTPSTLPMLRLAEYLRDFSALLGNESYVHFDRVGVGSAELTARAESTASPKIRTRLDEVVAGTAPKIAMKAHLGIDDLLAADNAIGYIRHGSSKIIEFPGRRRAMHERIGPARRHAALDGQIYQIGGKDETINIHLRDGDKLHRCECSIPLARRLAPYFLAGKVRLTGEGDWYRTDSGWTLAGFTATDFAVLESESFTQTVDRVRDLFKGVTLDPSQVMSDLRHG